MTLKQQKFVSEYLIDLNATQAAIRSGYSKRSAYSTAGILLGKPHIAKAVEKGMKECAERAKVSTDKVLRELALLAFENKNLTVKVRALELIGKHFGMFTDKLEHSGKIGVISELTDDELAASAATGGGGTTAPAPGTPDPS
jgi:phage terminase small subunit